MIKQKVYNDKKYRLIWAPLRLQRRYHADPLLTGSAIVVYICSIIRRLQHMCAIRACIWSFRAFLHIPYGIVAEKGAVASN